MHVLVNYVSIPIYVFLFLDIQPHSVSNTGSFIYFLSDFFISLFLVVTAVFFSRARRLTIFAFHDNIAGRVICKYASTITHKEVTLIPSVYIGED